MLKPEYGFRVRVRNPKYEKQTERYPYHYLAAPHRKLQRAQPLPSVHTPILLSLVHLAQNDSQPGYQKMPKFAVIVPISVFW